MQWTLRNDTFRRHSIWSCDRVKCVCILKARFQAQWFEEWKILIAVEWSKISRRCLLQWSNSQVGMTINWCTKYEALVTVSSNFPELSYFLIKSLWIWLDNCHIYEACNVRLVWQRNLRCQGFNFSLWARLNGYWRIVCISLASFVFVLNANWGFQC